MATSVNRAHRFKAGSGTLFALFTGNSSSHQKINETPGKTSCRARVWLDVCLGLPQGFPVLQSWFADTIPAFPSCFSKECSSHRKATLRCCCPPAAPPAQQAPVSCTPQTANSAFLRETFQNSVNFPARQCPGEGWVSHHALQHSTSI